MFEIRQEQQQTTELFNQKLSTLKKNLQKKRRRAGVSSQTATIQHPRPHKTKKSFLWRGAENSNLKFKA